MMITKVSTALLRPAFAARAQSALTPSWTVLMNNNTFSTSAEGTTTAASSVEKSVLSDSNTSTRVGERAIIDRIAAPGTGGKRKVPKNPIDYLEAARARAGSKV